MQSSTKVVESAEVEVMTRMSLREQLELYWKFLFQKGEKVPRVPLPQKRLDPVTLFNAKNKALRAAWLGHSSLLINMDGFSILTDPVFQRKVSPVGPVRFHRQLPLQPETLQGLDVVLISHDHYDHLNKYSIRLLAGKAKVFLAPMGVARLLRRWGVDCDRIVELNWWESYRTREGLEIIATPSHHFSGRTPFDRNSRLWASWVIRNRNHCLFFSGDSGYFGGFREIGRKYGPFDVVFMECGAYNERWPNVHMFPEQTVQACEDLGGRILQPIHWATFNLSFHPWYEPIERLSAVAAKRHIRLATPLIGQVADYETDLLSEVWWRSAMRQGVADKRLRGFCSHLQP